MKKTILTIFVTITALMGLSFLMEYFMSRREVVYYDELDDFWEDL